jgi:hypothetical protein
VRLVGEAQRALTKALELWSPEDPDDGRRWVRDSVDAVERLSRWMESSATQEAWAASA